MKTLENKSGDTALYSILVGVTYPINEVVQQTKHLYYHLKGVPHEKIERGEFDTDAFFDSYPMYVEKNVAENVTSPYY